MAGVSLSLLRSLYRSIDSSCKPHSTQVRRHFSRIAEYAATKSSSGFQKKEPYASFSLLNSHARAFSCGFPLVGASHEEKSSPRNVSFSSNLRLHNARSFGYSIPLLGHTSYSRAFSTTPGATGTGDGNGIDWVEKAKDVLQTSVDAVTQTANKAKEASSELSPHVQQLLDNNPYLNDVIVPVSLTMTGTLFAWVVMPKVLRRFHKYALQSSAALLPGGFSTEDVPYEKSFWSALEDPTRYLLTFIAFAQIAAMVAPTTVAAQYFSPAVRGAAILSFVWFLHRWKTNVITRMLSSNSIAGLDREKILTLDKVSSVGLFAVGVMASAEACGVAVQSLLTVGGVGGVATAFAARDILGNVLSGLSMQFSRPFSMGDTIKAGSVEGQVVEMGLTTTSLLNAEKFPVMVPNSLFSSQVIVNKSRAQWRAIASKIPLQIDDLDKIPQISNEIKEILRSNTKVYLGKEAPYCYLSRVEKSFAELTIGCNLKHMGKEELYTTQQDVLLEAVKIIKKHGASLGSTCDSSTSTLLYNVTPNTHRRKLSVYPNGNKSANGHVSIFLENQASVSVDFQYQVFVVSQLERIRHSNGKWTFGTSSVLKKMGTASLIALADLKPKGYLIGDCCMFGVKLFGTAPAKSGTAERFTLVEKPLNHRVTWKMTKFSSFQPERVHHSHEFVVGTRKWRIEIHPRGVYGGKEKSFSVYLLAEEFINSTPKTNTFAKFKLRVLDQVNRNHVEKVDSGWLGAQHGYRHGVADFMTLEKVNEPYLVKDMLYVGVEFEIIFWYNWLYF